MTKVIIKIQHGTKFFDNFIGKKNYIFYSSYSCLNQKKYNQYIILKRNHLFTQ